MRKSHDQQNRREIYPGTPIAEELLAVLPSEMRRMRQDARLTQAQLSGILGNAQSSVARVEGGRKSVDIDLFLEWAHATGWTVHTYGYSEARPGHIAAMALTGPPDVGGTRLIGDPDLLLDLLQEDLVEAVPSTQHVTGPVTDLSLITDLLTLLDHEDERVRSSVRVGIRGVIDAVRSRLD